MMFQNQLRSGRSESECATLLQAITGAYCQTAEAEKVNIDRELKGDTSSPEYQRRRKGINFDKQRFALWIKQKTIRKHGVFGCSRCKYKHTAGCSIHRQAVQESRWARRALQEMAAEYERRFGGKGDES